MNEKVYKIPTCPVCKSPQTEVNGKITEHDDKVWSDTEQKYVKVVCLGTGSAAKNLYDNDTPGFFRNTT